MYIKSYMGGADKYLQLLTNEIVPKAEKFMQGLAGYSLAGAFVFITR